MTTSFPVDTLTMEELQQLCSDSSLVDRVQYEAGLNLPMATDYMAKGFIVLVYDDQADKLVAAASAIDLMGLNTYEWSLLVHPMYRQIGLGTALFTALQQELENRSAVGQLALMMEQAGYGKDFIVKQGYRYSFSEATLEAKVQNEMEHSNVEIVPFEHQHTAQLVQVFCEAFGDDEQEALELIEYNATNEFLQLWVAIVDGQVAGSVTTRRDHDAYWITALAVHTSMQRKGVGTALIYAVHRLALAQGAAYIKLDVELENEQALMIYTKTGFLKVAQIDYFSKE